MAEIVTYTMDPTEPLRRIFKGQDVSHIVFDKAVNDNFDEVLEVVVTHDGTKGNESYIIANLFKPLVTRTRGVTIAGVVDYIWKVGHLTIQEKQGKVMAAGRLVNGVAQKVSVPVKLFPIKKVG